VIYRLFQQSGAFGQLLIDAEKGERKAQSCDNAFHEKAGRSQVGSVVFFIGQGFSPAELATVAMLPSALW
jgi:hypothetical protein